MRIAKMIASGVLGGGVAPSSLRTGLIAYWKMDESSDGSASVARADASGGAHTANDPLKVASAAAVINNGLSFSGASYLSVADHADLRCGDRDFTIAAWVYISGVQSGNSTIVSKWDGNTGKREFNLLIAKAAARFQFYVSSDGGGTNIALATANNLGVPQTDTWYFIVAWHDSVNNQIGIQVNNGTADTTSHTAGVYSNNAPVGIGALLPIDAGAANNFLSGMIDEVARWNRILTTDEKTALYGGGAGNQYPFDYAATMVDGFYFYSSSIEA